MAGCGLFSALCSSLPARIRRPDSHAAHLAEYKRVCPGPPDAEQKKNVVVLHSAIFGCAPAGTLMVEELGSAGGRGPAVERLWNGHVSSNDRLSSLSDPRKREAGRPGDGRA